MRINKRASWACILLLSISFIVQACTDKEVYDREMFLDTSNAYGYKINTWKFKYPKSFTCSKDGTNFIFVDEAILRTLANDPEGWGYGCYCAFKTLIKPDQLLNDRDDYVNAPTIMLRGMEVECFPKWVNEDFETHIFELQQAATERILSKSGYEVTDWKSEKSKVINNINVYIYTYKTVKDGVEVKYKVACLIKGIFTCELSLRTDRKNYGKWESKFDKILATVELSEVEEGQEQN